MSVAETPEVGGQTTDGKLRIWNGGFQIQKYKNIWSMTSHVRPLTSRHLGGKYSWQEAEEGILNCGFQILNFAKAYVFNSA